MSAQPTPALKANAIGLIGAATFGVVMMSPAITIYGSFGPSFIAAGKLAPLAFLLAFVATLPTAVSYALCSREHPDSGSAASWAMRVVPERPAIAVSWMVFFYYFLNFIIQPVTMGVFFNELLSMLGLPSGFPSFALGAILCCAIPASVLYKGINHSSKGALGFLLLETSIVIALCVSVGILASHSGASVAKSQLPDAVLPLAGAGIFQAMIFGIFSFCGYDVISTLAEEAKAPRHLIPKATFLALSLFALIIISGIWLLTLSADPVRLKQVADAGGMPIREIAVQYWGRGALLIPITAISAALGLVIATGVGSSRVLYAMCRRGHGPEIFAKVHAHYQVPWNATHLIMGAGLASTLLTGAILGPYRTWVWWGTASTLFAMVTYIVVNFSNFYLFRDRIFTSPRAFFLHAVVPFAGIAMDLAILVKCFFIETWQQDFAMGKSIVLFGLACAAIAITFAFRSARQEAQTVPV